MTDHETVRADYYHSSAQWKPNHGRELALTCSVSDLFQACEDSSIHVQLYLLQSDEFVNNVRLEVCMGLGLRRAYRDFIVKDYQVTVFSSIRVPKSDGPAPPTSNIIDLWWAHAPLHVYRLGRGMAALTARVHAHRQ